VTRSSFGNGPASFSSLSRRANSVNEPLSNNLTFGGYIAIVKVGTPAQTVSLVLSTGSSDLWLLDDSSTTCLQKNASCITPFNSGTSQTLSTVSVGGFDIAYADGSSARGNYIKDAIFIGEENMILQMGLALNSSINYGIMGIGYDSGEATSNLTYPNFLDELILDGYINSKAYSLWLNDLESSTGCILFGGIDTQKYYGTLYSMPIHLSSTGLYDAFNVLITAISLTPQIGSNIALTNSSFSEVVLLESSTTLIYLPDNIVDQIYSIFNVSTVDECPWVDCKFANSSFMSVAFESGSVIDIPYTEIIFKSGVPNPLPAVLQDLTFSDVCYFAIQPAGSSPNILGQFFLRSAYVVYDLTNNRIGIAQSLFNATRSNIIEIGPGGASIPQSTGVSSPVPSATNPSTSSGSPGTPMGPSASTSPSQPTQTGKSNHAVAIGVGVSVPIVLILAVIVGFCFWWRRRKQSQFEIGHEKAPKSVPELVGDSRLSELVGDSTVPELVGDLTQNELSADPPELLSEMSASPIATSPRTQRSIVPRKPVPSLALPTHPE